MAVGPRGDRPASTEIAEEIAEEIAKEIEGGPDDD